MKAMAIEKYGGVEQFKMIETAVPVPKENEVLIKVHAVSINSWDWDMLQGKPIFIRLWGLFKPKVKILGSDVAGVVEAVGSSVKRFKVGDRVFGDLVENNWGGFAEYTCAKENALTAIPDNTTFIHAAAFPQGACMAYQAITEAHVQNGEKVLINGAGGGCGSFAVQFAKLRGAEVTGVDKRDKFDFMTAIGVDHLLDYQANTYTETGDTYDVIIDMVMHHPLKDIDRILNSKGRFRMVGGLTKRIFEVAVGSKRLSSKSDKDIKILAASANYQLSEVAKLIEKGDIKPNIDKVYGLEDVPQAMAYIGKGHVKGKIVVSIID